MPLQSTLLSQGKGLCLLSLDAGGTRGVSQMKILAGLMYRLNFETAEGQTLLPCEVFDMIGGSGSGGFIAILLAVLGLSTEQALNEFIQLTSNILEREGIEAPTRTAALKTHIEILLDKYGIRKDTRLLDSQGLSKGCKLVVPISYKQHVGSTCMFRNFCVRQEEALNVTIAEAMMATLASPPLFTSTSIVKDSSTFEYISSDLTLSNPTHEVISEAYGTFGKEARVACLLSIGCGHPGVIKSPDSSDKMTWIQFLEKLSTNSEQKAEELQARMGHLGLYYRFSVTRGLEMDTPTPGSQTGDTIAHTTVYVTGFEVSGKMDLCADSLKARDGMISLEQLRQSGGQVVLSPALPPVTKNFVMRRKPWEFIEKAMLGTRDANEQRMLVITGMGGCGKTQLILKFVHVHKDKFTTAFFFDGSSMPQIRADTIRHVRSLGVAHSQKDFEDCLLFLAQPCPGRPRLIVYDNVDDPDIDLAPLLPLGESCAIVITSRNRSIGEFSPETHLELDIMSLEEAVEVLLQRAGRPIIITDRMRDEAGAIAQALGCLPIALTQARSYMYQTQCSLGGYLERLLRNRDKLLAQPIKYHRDMRYISTYAAFGASFGLLTSECQHLLRLLSYFHWSNFPLELVILAAKHNFSDYEDTYLKHGEEYYTGTRMLKTIFLRGDKWDITDFDEMVVSLRNHSLITLVPGIGTQLVQMHPVAHRWAKSCIIEQEMASYQAAAVVLLALGSRDEYTPSAQYLASHVNHMSPIWDQICLSNAEAFAKILSGGGSLEGTLQLRERVVTELLSQADPDGMSIGSSNWALASTYASLGRYEDAQPLLREALELATKILGKYHPYTIMAFASLALVYREMGQLNEAVLLQEDMLINMKETLGERHPDIITMSSNLATTYGILGQSKEAKALQEEVLRIMKDMLGEYHPDTVAATASTAITYRDLGHLIEAKMLQEKVLRIQKEILGEYHPDTISAANNLSITYSDLGLLSDAESLQEVVLRTRKEILGKFHPDTISVTSNLANTYCQMGRLIEAKALQEEVLAVRKEKLGERHPDTLATSNNIADIYLLSGQPEDAKALQVETLRQAQEVLGDRHPTTAIIMLTLAEIYESLCRKEDALELLDIAEHVFAEKFGTNNPHYLECQQLRTRLEAEPKEEIRGAA